MTDWFYPGFKAGGPIRACYNLAFLLKDEYDIYIYTRDRDLNSNSPYRTVCRDNWSQFSDSIEIFYSSPENLNWFSIIKEIRKIGPGFIYLNSMYSLYFTIYPLLIKRIGKTQAKIILSPRGMLKAGSMQFKHFKKKSFLSLLKFSRMSSGIGFHATDEQEKDDIRKVFGHAIPVDTIQDVPPTPANSLKPVEKKAGELKLVFIGRIHPVKNLHFIIECLKRLPQKIELTVVGPAEDRSYFLYCQRLSRHLPNNISVNFTGEVSNEKIKDYLNRHHFMILPTFGENYCYSIIESFCAGRPVIITNKTPWQDLTRQKIGWDLPLNQKEDFEAALNHAAEMVQEEFSEWSASALNFSRTLAFSDRFKTQYTEMFS